MRRIRGLKAPFFDVSREVRESCTRECVVQVARPERIVIFLKYFFKLAAARRRSLLGFFLTSLVPPVARFKKVSSSLWRNTRAMPWPSPMLD